MFDNIGRQAVHAKTHSLCHLCKTFGFDLMLERICREICTFTVNFSFDHSKCGTHTIQLDLVQFWPMGWHIYHLIVKEANGLAWGHSVNV